MVGPSFAEDLVGALRLVGSFSEGEVQEHADRLINAQQEAEGLVATFCHEDDGEVPQSVFSVMDTGGPREDLGPSLVERLLEGMVPSGKVAGALAAGLEGEPSGDGGLNSVQAFTE